MSAEDSIDHHGVTDTIRYVPSRGTTVRLTLDSSGAIRLTHPWWMPKRLVTIFLHKNRAWIERQKERVRKTDPVFLSRSRSHYLRHRERARELVEERCRAWSNLLGVGYGRISVRNQRTRWGSCSGKQNLSFNYKILFLSEELRDYLVVHELCHLKEMNHSPRFWNLVARCIPEYKTRKAQLRDIVLG